MWLTLVVALGLGWWCREQQLQTDLGRARSRAATWQMASGALEYALKEAGCHVEVDFDALEVFVLRPTPGMTLQSTIDMAHFAPSDHDD